jgi:hypothetical protein
MKIVGPILDTVAISLDGCRGYDGWGDGEACKRIHHPLMRSLRVCCLASSAVTLWGCENKRLPLHTLMSYHTISWCLPIFFLAPEEKEREKKAKTKGKD